MAAEQAKFWAFRDALIELEGLVHTSALDPDPKRSDWGDHQAEIKVIVLRLGRELRDQLGEGLAQADSEARRDTLRTRTAELFGQVAALVRASGDASGGSRLLAEGAEIAPAGTTRDGLIAARREPDAFGLLARARFLQEFKKFSAAEALLREVVKTTREDALSRAAADGLKAARPVTSAPPLFRINGCGVGLYKTGPVRPDGSYVAAYCLSLLFIPVLPLRAYRVKRDGNRYGFYSVERLGLVARLWRWLLVAGVLAAVGAVMVGHYLHSPTRMLAHALDQARATEARDPKQAIERYEAAIRRYHDEVSTAALAPAAEAAARLILAEVPEPLDVAQLDQATRAMARIGRLSGDLRRRQVNATLIARVEHWAAGLGGSGAGQAGVIKLYDQLVTLVPEPARTPVERHRGELHRAAATALAADWPANALAMLVDLGSDAEALRAAVPILTTMARDGWLLDDVRHDVAPWLEAARGHADFADTVALVDKTLAGAQALRDDEARAKLLAGDEKTLAAALHAHPTDQPVAVALAVAQYRRGDSAGALATLRTLGKPGWLIASGQILWGKLLGELGQPGEADALLGRIVSVRLPRFQAARALFEHSLESLQTRLVADANSGSLPDGIEATIKSQPDSAGRQKVFDAWLHEQMTSDPEVVRVRTSYLEQMVVVPAVLEQAFVKLRRAAGAPPDERAALLAATEALFLSIQDEDSERPEYHLGLGQVYHRLGKSAEGERELQTLIDQGDPQLMLQVSEAYRALGLVARARTVAQAALDKGSGPTRTEAVLALAELEPDLDAQAAWLAKGDPSSEAIRLRQLDVEATRALERGAWVEADKAFAGEVAAYERRAAHDPVAANNAAIAHGGRYRATGDPAQLTAETALLEAALRMAPDNAIVMTNLASHLAYTGQLAVLDHFVHTRVLKPTPSDVDQLGTLLVAGPSRAEVLELLAKEPAVRRGRELAARAELLSPQAPGPYQLELDLAALLDDSDTLRALHERVARQPIESTERDEEVQRWRDGGDDERMRVQLDATAKRLEQIVNDAEREHHRPTLSAAHILVGAVQFQLSDLDGLPAASRAAIAMRKAAETDPLLDTSIPLASVLVQIATLKAAESSPALATAWKRLARSYSPIMLVTQLEPARLAEIRAQAELSEAVKARLGAARSSGADWVLASVAGSRPLETQAEAAFKRADLLPYYQVSVALGRLHDDAAAQLAVLTRAK